ncbi:hypothetical protein KSP40_PGU000356 [Platanthera guangdongensis]|uniref:Uncharacterized protein n=1 Tax=Platanthera guangdongensis TaxID=2320717 RepID=A0ABR2LT04_9ASPA
MRSEDYRSSRLVQEPRGSKELRVRTAARTEGEQKVNRYRPRFVEAEKGEFTLSGSRLRCGSSLLPRKRY